MNRTIKFRGKSTNNDKWVYAELHGFGMDLFNECVRENTIGQFTGLFDKNGKEIYEGDILLLKDETDQEDPGECYEVGFKKGCFGYISKYGGELLSFCDYEIEEDIVGNISDNPELMKGENLCQ